jgi:hypothetical protein
MNRRAILGALAGAGVSIAYAAEPDHSAFDRLLQIYVKPGTDGLNRVDYAGWRANGADRAALDAYIMVLSGTAASRLTRLEQWAFWANLYNAITVQVILDRYPVGSIRDIRSTGAGLSVGGLIGPWKTKRVVVEGRNLSLDDIEHAIMRPTFKDPRVHYSVNCASIGCPNLPRRAFRAASLEADLDANARAFINSPRGVRVVRDGVRLSSIYTWFKEDFGTQAQLRAHLAKYAQPALAAQIQTARILGHDYDWKLNDAKAPA